MIRKSKVTISRKWNTMDILIWVSNRSIGMQVDLDDFVEALSLSVMERLPCKLADKIGNPLLIVSKSQLQEKIHEALSKILPEEMNLSMKLVEQEIKDKTSELT